MAIAHTKNSQGVRQGLVDHLQQVADKAAFFGMRFGANKLAYLAGILHDIGKFNPAFQQYLLDAETHPHMHQRGPDHKGAGALLASDLHLDPLAFLVAGHHGGLHASSDLKVWLNERSADSDVRAAVAIAQATLPVLSTSTSPSLPAYIRSKLEGEFFIRMLFSALVDADFLDTEHHFNAGKANLRSAYPDLVSLEPLFEANQHALTAQAMDQVNVLRHEVYTACITAAVRQPGLFSLTVPTGGGKTRSSLAFALRHANTHNLRRVIYAIPYTSITEQTADTFRAIFGEQAVLEHHSGVMPSDPDNPTPKEVVSRLAAENWDAPLIVTTTVQLFESLMARGTSACRKLHNIASSVVILDEAQTLPTHLLVPILDVLRQLVAHYRVTVVLCTATQPALDTGARTGFAGLEGIREIAPDLVRLFAELKRVKYFLPQRGERWSWERVADVMGEEKQALAIVNTRANAVALLHALDDPDALHLSTWMCGAHRRRTLAEARRRLSERLPCQLVSTQVIEAGVDIDFPLVLRALGPLDSIVQAAGRCNRNGLLPSLGRVIVFEPEESNMPPGSYRTGTEVALALLSTDGFDFHDPAVYRRYFERYYGKIDPDEKRIQPLREALDYPEVETRFRMIGDDTLPAVIVAYEEGDAKPAVALVEEVRKEPNQARVHLRALQPYIVTLRRHEMRRAIERGVAYELAEVPGLYIWQGTYDSVRGIDPEGYLDANTLIV